MHSNVIPVTSSYTIICNESPHTDISAWCDLDDLKMYSK